MTNLLTEGPRREGGGDPKVAEVVGHWLPRFVANDLDPSDVSATLDRVREWRDWPAEWSATADEYAHLGQEALDRGRTATAAAHLRRAALTLQFAQFVLTEDEELRTRLHRRQCELYALAAPHLSPPAQRIEVPFQGASMPGYLRRPAGVAAPPLVVLVPGLESTKEQFSTYEPHFLERGVATLSIEGPGQGETWSALAFSEERYAAALRALAGVVDGLEGIDARRVVVLGTSFGGHLVLRGATAFPGLRGIVAIAGPYDLSAWDELPEVVRDGLARMIKADGPAQARPLLADVTLDGALDAIAVPVLVLHGERDKVIPPAEARRIAGALGERAELWLEPTGGHSCNNLHTRVRPAVADWVAERA